MCTSSFISFIPFIHPHPPPSPLAPILTDPLRPRQLLLRQEPLLLHPTLLQIQENDQQARAQTGQAEQEIERGAVVPVGTGVDDGARDERADEGGCFADDGEEGEEEELFAPGRHFGDHDLGVRVPGADEEAVEGLVDPEFPDVVEAECLGPDAYHAPTVAVAIQVC